VSGAVGNLAPTANQRLAFQRRLDLRRLPSQRVVNGDSLRREAGGKRFQHPRDPRANLHIRRPLPLGWRGRGVVLIDSILAFELANQRLDL
jgi:hypothetical protein